MSNKLTVDEILSDMAFKCAGGITHDGKKEYVEAKAQLSQLVNEIIEEESSTKTFKLLWKMYEELLEERMNDSPRDSSGTIISRYANKIILVNSESARTRAIERGFTIGEK